MASLAKTRSLFGFTSPRTLEKIIPEIELLTRRFKGRPWTPDTQRKFFEELVVSDFYEDSRPTQNLDFAARDRITRAPKALGFVKLQSSIGLTTAGQLLLTDIESRPDTFTRQLLKFQLPSPYHTAPKNDLGRFSIRPYLELLRLVRDVGPLTKTEIEIFFLPLTNVVDYDKTVKDLLDFRRSRKKLKTGRKAFVQAYADRVTQRIYQNEISAGKFGTRQGRTETAEEFIAKKQRNGTDYADAFIRYLRATQLVTVDPNTFHLVVSAQRQAEVDYILTNVPRDPVTWQKAADYEAYLFDPDSLRLLSDDKTYLLARLQTLNAEALPTASLPAIRQLVRQEEQRHQAAQTATVAQQLKHYQQYDEVDALFERLLARAKVPDAPLWLEYNVWRALTMMNYAVRIQGNYAVDLDGIPLHTAAGNQPDLTADYGSFQLLVEVTLSGGQRQFEMEGESVARHLGKARAAAPAGVPVYCLFLAPTISAATLGYFYSLNKIHVAAHGGKTTIVPMPLAYFRQLVARGRQAGFNQPAQLHHLLNKLLAAGDQAVDENGWLKAIEQQVASWLA